MVAGLVENFHVRAPKHVELQVKPLKINQRREPPTVGLRARRPEAAHSDRRTHTFTHACIRTYIQYVTYIHTRAQNACRNAPAHTYIQTYRQIDRQTDRPTDRQTNRHTYIQTHIHYIDTYINTYVHTYMHTYIRTSAHTYIYTHLHTNKQTYIHTYMHTYIHTYKHKIYMHTYIHHARTRACDNRQTGRLTGRQPDPVASWWSIFQIHLSLNFPNGKRFAGGCSHAG